MSLHPASFAGLDDDDANNTSSITKEISCVEKELRDFEEVDSVLGRDFNRVRKISWP